MSSSRHQGACLIGAVLGMGAVAPVICSSCGAGPATADEKQMEGWWVELDHIGTADAAAILKDMATGHADAYPTNKPGTSFGVFFTAFPISP